MVCLVWAGKDVAFSESAGKYLFSTLACNKLILCKEWSAKLRFCFLMGLKAAKDPYCKQSIRKFVYNSATCQPSPLLPSKAICSGKKNRPTCTSWNRRSRILKRKQK